MVGAELPTDGECQEGWRTHQRGTVPKFPWLTTLHLPPFEQEACCEQEGQELPSKPIASDYQWVSGTIGHWIPARSFSTAQVISQVLKTLSKSGTWDMGDALEGLRRRPSLDLSLENCDLTQPQWWWWEQGGKSVFRASSVQELFDFRWWQKGNILQ